MKAGLMFSVNICVLTITDPFPFFPVFLFCFIIKDVFNSIIDSSQLGIMFADPFMEFFAQFF